MADNVLVNTGTGATVATDQIGTAHYQKVKLVVGASDTATPILLGQTNAAGSLPVVVANDQSTIPVSVVAFTPGGTQNTIIVSTATVTGSVSLSGTGNVTVSAITTGVVSVSAGNIAVSNTPTVTVSTALALPVVTVTASANPLVVTGIMTVPASGTQNVTLIAGTVSTVLALPVLSAANVSIASITAGTLDKITLVSTISTLLGTVAVSGGGGGVQYSIGETAMAATGTGTLILGLQSGATTARGLAVTTTGGIFNVQTVATITTLLGTVAVSGGGGGVQYTINATDMAATGTGTLMLGLQSGATTARGIALTTTGGVFNVQTVATITTLLGTVAVSGGGGGVQYSIGDTSMAATGTGTIILGMQSGATTSRALALTVTGGITSLASVTTILALPVLSASNVTIASITTGTVSVIAMPVLSATNITVASITAGTISTVLALPVVVVTASANPIVVTGTITAPASGTQNVILISGTVSTVLAMPVLSATGVTLAATTAVVGAFVATAHGSKWNAYAVNTTSGAATILKTSGAHTLYVTDLMISVDVPSMVTLMSSATTQLVAYLATKGGFVMNLNTPMVLNSAQSLTFQPSASGSCAAFAAGFTVT